MAPTHEHVDNRRRNQYDQQHQDNTLQRLYDRAIELRNPALVRQLLLFVMQMGCATIAFYVVNTHAARYANHVGGKLRAAMLSQTCLVANNALRNGADQSVEKVHVQKIHQRSEGKSHCQKRKKNMEIRLCWREDFYCTTTP